MDDHNYAFIWWNLLYHNGISRCISVFSDVFSLLLAWFIPVSPCKVCSRDHRWTVMTYQENNAQRSARFETWQTCMAQVMSRLLVYLESFSLRQQYHWLLHSFWENTGLFGNRVVFTSSQAATMSTSEKELVARFAKKSSLLNASKTLCLPFSFQYICK